MKQKSHVDWFSGYVKWAVEYQTTKYVNAFVYSGVIVALSHCLQLEVAVLVGRMWTIFQPLLFGLIGSEVSLKQLHIETVGLGLAVLFIGLVMRIITSFLVVFGLGLRIREQVFVALAWLPKATVQVTD